MIRLRDAEAGDGPFLTEMLAVAADWRPEAQLRTAGENLAVPEFAHYVLGWPRSGDCGVIAGIDGLVGAVWYRFLASGDAGYGYLADDIPELTLGVAPAHRGGGVGTALVNRLVERARDAGLAAVSLSVERDNPATRLYRRAGFAEVGHAEGAATMILRLHGG